MLATNRRRVAFVVVQILLVALVASATYIVTRPTASASGTARLTIFKGAVQLRQATTTISHNGTTGELLVQSEEVTTGPQTWAAINFPDGSVTRLPGGKRWSGDVISHCGPHATSLWRSATLERIWTPLFPTPPRSRARESPSPS